MPSYDVTSHIQPVFRYTYLKRVDNNGIRLAHYDNGIVKGRGVRYDEFYGGLNMFFYGHKLKWQTGLQYGTTEDAADIGGQHQGWGLTSGLRVSW
jgi:phosphate-selective porin OprO/OprP